MSGFSWSRALKSAAGLLAFLLASLFPLAANAADEEGCLACHGLSGYALIRADGVQSLAVSQQQFDSSIHSLLTCRECHTEISAIPHPGAPGENICGEECHQRDSAGNLYSHEAIFWGYSSSVHGRSGRLSTGCLSCHSPSSLVGPSRRDLANEVRQCAACHHDNGHVRSYFRGLHYLALSGGERRAPSCPDCHSAHRILPAGDPESTVHPKNLTSTCGAGAVESSPAGRCHGGLGEGAARDAGMEPLLLPGKDPTLLGWILTLCFWGTAAGLLARIGLGLTKGR